MEFLTKAIEDEDGYKIRLFLDNHIDKSIIKNIIDHRKAIPALVENGLDPYSGIYQGNTLLHYAVMAGSKIAVSRVILKYPELLNVKNDAGFPPIWYSIKRKSSKRRIFHPIFNTLFNQYELDLDIFNKKCPVLLKALQKDDLNIADKLLTKEPLNEYPFLFGADLNVDIISDKAIDYIIKKGLNLSESVHAHYGNIMHVMAARDTSGYMVHHLMHKHGVFVDIKNHKTKTPLMIACANENYSAAMSLINSASLNEMDNDRMTALSYCIINETLTNLSIAEELISKKCLIDIPVTNCYISHLALACKLGRTQSIRLLIKSGADTNYRSREGLYPIHYYMKCFDTFQYICDNDVATVFYLFKESDMDHGIVDKEGYPLIFYTVGHNITFTKYLVKLLGDICMQHINIINGDYLLHHAIRKGCYTIFNALMETNEKFPNLTFFINQNFLGETPLSLSIKMKRYDMAEKLIYNKGNMITEDKNAIINCLKNDNTISFQTYPMLYMMKTDNQDNYPPDKKYDEEICYICMNEESTDTRYYFHICGHYVHKKCFNLSELVQQKCGLCSKPILYIYKENSEKINKQNPST